MNARPEGGPRGGGAAVTDRVRELLAYLVDPRWERLFAGEDPNQYVPLGDYLQDLSNARDRARGRVALPAEVDALIELLGEIDAETSVRAVYGEGHTMYIDSSGRRVEDPRRRWQEYVASHPRWKRARSLARAATLGLESASPGPG